MNRSTRKYSVFLNETDSIAIEVSDSKVRIDGKQYSFDGVFLDDSNLSLILDGHPYRIFRSNDAKVATSHQSFAISSYSITINGSTFHVTIPSGRSFQQTTLGKTSPDQANSLVIAPMPGLVRKVEANVGDLVAVGQGIIVLEAMKMENEIRSHMKGVLSEIRVECGQTVERGDALFVVKALDGSA